MAAELKKNDYITLEIIDCALSGSGVGRHEGLAVFVPCTATGDTVEAHILKVSKGVAFAKVNRLLTASPDRIEPSCPAFPRCGGCVFRHISYEAELKIKQRQVGENFRRIGHIDLEPLPIIGADSPERYRNKAQYPVRKENGALKIGFFAPRSHRIIDCRTCLLEPESFEKILAVFARFITENNISVFDETTGRGIVRHIYIREAPATGEIMVCAVINAPELPGAEALASALLEAEPRIKSVVCNINQRPTNVILGDKCVTVAGEPFITDVLCGLKIRISPLSFYQVNSAQAQRLFTTVSEFAALDKSQTVLDLYCGAGIIGLSLASQAKQVIGVEVVPEAVEDAKINASLNDIRNAEFICSDAVEAAKLLASRGTAADIVILDPPRKGCARELLVTAAEMNPKKIIYVSCDSATQARDCAILEELGYHATALRPVDMFPRAAHVESVCLLTRS